MGFNDIIGQQKIIDYLKISIKKNRVAHGYIFDGPDGVGKAMVALRFAQALYCKNFDGDGCGICSCCHKVMGGNHPDIKIIEPEGASIKNSQIEDFQKDLMVKPYESSKKVYIIKNADDMTVSAQNRLLKTLEEPPEYGVIILLSTNGNSFLPTIRSRCQILKFQRVGQKYIEGFMMDKYHMAVEEARILAAFSDGIIGKAMALHESDEFKRMREETIQIIDRILEKDPIEVFVATEFFKQNKENIYEILDVLLLWFRDMLLLGQTGSDEFLINLDKKDLLKNHLDRMGYEGICDMIGRIEKTKNDIKANVNFQLSIEMMLLNMQEV